MIEWVKRCVNALHPLAVPFRSYQTSGFTTATALACPSGVTLVLMKLSPGETSGDTTTLIGQSGSGVA